MAHKCNLCRQEFPSELAYPHVFTHKDLQKASWVCWGCFAKLIEECKDGTKGVRIKSGFSRKVQIVPVK